MDLKAHMFAKLENIGRVKDTRFIEGTLLEIAKETLVWASGLHKSHELRIRICDDPEGLKRIPRGDTKEQAAQSEIEALFADFDF